MQEPLGFRAWLGHPAAMKAAHRHSDIELNYLSEGEMTYLLGGHVVQVPAGRLCLMWGAIPHQLIQSQARSRCGWVTVPFTWMLQWQLPQQVMAPLLGGSLVVDYAPDAGDGEAVRRWAGDLRQADHRWREVAALEVEARLRRMALSQAGRPVRRQEGQRAAAGGDAIAHVGRMAEYLAAHYRRTIRMQEVGESVGLHPNYAMALFRQYCGMSLVEYLTHYRVSQAQRLLATTEESVTDIAMDSGFGSLSRFFEAFAEVCGQSPRRYRQAVGRKTAR